jgi:hypothetical protein
MRVLRLGKCENSLILRKVAVNTWLALSWPVSAMQKLPERSKDCEGFVSAGTKIVAPVSRTAYWEEVVPRNYPYN